ncbi:glycosyltransferase [Aeromicrobium sp. UC242_57]|uniref:glycosyltransferase n=1 Tax=Aeromicrobium sp. UC242_57 TaxID=3374624 RepID=UPI0037931655
MGSRPGRQPRGVDRADRAREGTAPGRAGCAPRRNRDRPRRAHHGSGLFRRRGSAAARSRNHLPRPPPQPRLSTLVGRARVAVVSPQWDEPYGLVAAEAMACGTPVAALARGALPELVRPDTGALARTEDPEGLAAAMHEASKADRSTVRHHAVSSLSLDRMVSEYETLYESARFLDRAAG